MNGVEIVAVVLGALVVQALGTQYKLGKIETGAKIRVASLEKKMERVFRKLGKLETAINGK